jgi:hypothetical protein
MDRGSTHVPAEACVPSQYCNRANLIRIRDTCSNARMRHTLMALRDRFVHRKIAEYLHKQYPQIEYTVHGCQVKKQPAHRSRTGTCKHEHELVTHTRTHEHELVVVNAQTRQGGLAVVSRVGVPAPPSFARHNTSQRPTDRHGFRTHTTTQHEPAQHATPEIITNVQRSCTYSRSTCVRSSTAHSISTFFDCTVSVTRATCAS